MHRDTASGSACYSPRVPWTLQDAAAALVSIILAVAVAALSLLSIEIPSALATGMGAAISWLFIRSAQAANGVKAANGDRTHG